MHTKSGLIGIEVEEDEIGIRVTLQGDINDWNSQESASEIIAQVLGNLRTRNQNNLIVDLSAVTGEVTFLRRYHFLRKISKLYFTHRSLGGLQANIALVISAGQVHQSGYARDMLRIRGLHIEVFSSIGDAADWIKGFTRPQMSEKD